MANEFAGCVSERDGLLYDIVTELVDGEDSVDPVSTILDDELKQQCGICDCQKEQLVKIICGSALSKTRQPLLVSS